MFVKFVLISPRFFPLSLSLSQSKVTENIQVDFLFIELSTIACVYPM